MKARIGRWLAFASAGHFALAACDVVKIESSAEGPARPSGVPEKAIWAGGVDGGNFILMSPARPDGTYLLKVYHDYTGELEFEGAVRPDGASSTPIAVGDGSTFNSWDGTRLSLMDGRTLSPAKK
jgi:hypothetical protein